MRLEDALWQNPKRMSGAVCFRDTRIPVSILFDYLEAGELEEFYEGYPDVTPEQVRAVIEASRQLVEAELSPRRVA